MPCSLVSTQFRVLTREGSFKRLRKACCFHSYAFQCGDDWLVAPKRGSRAQATCRASIGRLVMSM